MQWSRVGKLYLPQIAIFVLDKEEIKLWVQKKFFPYSTPKKVNLWTITFG